ncbi:Rad17 cell cycle checkpoint protein-domain-containing protein [Phlebopus sp. FC_14]|nr:Rad17 cell cycle checkpoint protein-domain-containing protein [Phlebopus sp. FC_14]
MSRKPSKKVADVANKKVKGKLKTVTLDIGEPPAKKLRPLSVPFTPPTAHPEDDRLWVDKYEPTSEAELAVHKRKVEDVRRWLLEAFDGGPSTKLRKYRRILALTGPAGTAKTAALRVLSREMGFEILEWRNSMSERSPYYSALFDKFQAFLTRAMTCNSVFSTQKPSFQVPSGSGTQSSEHRLTQSSKPSSAHGLSQPQSTTSPVHKRQLVLLEDLPNLLHLPTQARFQAALQSLCIPADSSTPGPPIVVVISDAGVRAEQPDDETWDGGSSGGRRWTKDVLDVRNVLGPELLASPYVTRIGFNPIAPTLMTKALHALLALHFGSQQSLRGTEKQPPREVLDIIVESSNGDIRSAINALQFACVVPLPGSSAKQKGSRKSEKKPSQNMTRRNGRSVRAVLEAVTRREQSLVLFHLMGKILYNKRKFDPPASHLSAKEAAKERELDLQLLDPAPLPEWLSSHERKASRVCVETLASDSPIDSYLLGAYIHQNYPQFCTDIEQCDAICEGLSWSNCVGGLQNQFMNTPYEFPILTLSTLHGLPTPVPRTGQKMCKPAWFDVRARELEAWDAVGDVASWLGRSRALGTNALGEDEGTSMGRWTHSNIATELGGWLRAVERSPQENSNILVPKTHRLFSHLPWTTGATVGDALGEEEDGEMGMLQDENDDRIVSGALRVEDSSEGWWLEADDIEEVE